MSIALRNEPNDNKYYMNGEWLNVCSRDAFGFSAKNEKGEIVLQEERYQGGILEDAE